MEKKRACVNLDPGSSFSHQPARVLLVEALPPWWSSINQVLCEALENVLTLASSVDGPHRIPLLSVYALSRQRECLLPFMPVRGNLQRLRSCVEELRCLPGEGCERVAATRAEQLTQGILDSLQQFKQYQRHSSNSQASNCSVEVTVLSSQLGRSMVHLLEQGLMGADLVSLRRLQLVHIDSSVDWSQIQDSAHPLVEASFTQAEDSFVLGAEVLLLKVDNTVFALEAVLKSWLHEQGGDREHLQLLLLSPGDTTVCVKCDMQERLVSPALISLTPPLGAKTESSRDFQPGKASANQSAVPQRLKAIKVLRADGLCQSLLYGLPLLLRPSSSWSLDWDDMEKNHSLFHALCLALRSREQFLLLQSDSFQTSTSAKATGVHSHYVLQSSASVTLLLKPVVSRELFLPCSTEPSTQPLSTEAQLTIQACLGQLQEESVFNPLLLHCNLFSHLRSRGLTSQPQYTYKAQSAMKSQATPLEGSKNTGKQPRQGRKSGANSKIRATVAPLPPSSASALCSTLMGPPPAKICRPALLFSSSNGSGADRRALGPPVCAERPMSAHQEEESLNME